MVANFKLITLDRKLRKLIEADSEIEKEIDNILKRHKHTRKNETVQSKRSKVITDELTSRMRRANEAICWMNFPVRCSLLRLSITCGL